MVLNLLLILILLTSCMFCGGSEADPKLQVQCRAFRYPVSIDCSWTQSPSPNGTMPTEFIATYRVVMDEIEYKPCFQVRPSFPNCTIMDFMTFSNNSHELNVTAIYPEGVSTTILPFVPLAIIKPDPPENIRLTPLSGNKLQLQWDAPQTWPYPHIFRLRYYIQYKDCKSEHFIQVGPTKETTFIVSSVQPHDKYCIQVNARHRYGYSEPSEWSLLPTFPLTPGK